MLQYVSFKLDKVYPECWVKDHELFDCKADINSEKYHRKVFLLAKGSWQEIEDFYSEDAERFKIRLQHSWKGKDTLYDAWLLSQRKTREQFHMEKFLERYPKWPELWEELYGENGKFTNSSQEICSAPVQNVLANEYKDPTDSPCQSPPLQKKRCHEASPGSQPPSPPLRKKPCCETPPEKLTEETMDGMNKTDEGKGHSGCQNKGEREDQYSGSQVSK